MNSHQTQLKTHHRFRDYLYWNLLLAIPFVTAATAIFRESIMWLAIYIVVSVLLIAVVYRFFCTHCPHYIQGMKTVKCMFFWGIPKFFGSRPGPLSLFDKTVSFITPIILIMFPLYWLGLHIDLLVIYFLSIAVLFTTIRRNECGRCIYINCPANCVTKAARNESHAP